VRQRAIVTGLAVATALCGVGTTAGVAWGQPQPPAVSTLTSHHAALVEYQREHGYLPRPRHAGNEPVHAAPGTAAAPAAATGRAPVAGPAWVGVADTRYAPADPVDAIGPTSFIEMVNTKVAIYSRTGSLTASASTEQLTGGNPGDQSDPQVMWDPATNRFYYSSINVTTERIEVGFSKSASPTSIPGSFCNYHVDFGFGKALPDYQKLGSTTHDLLIGANVFPDDPNAAIHADVAWMTKPGGTGTLSTCPPQSSFKTGRQGNLLDHSVAGQGWTPVPAQQDDPSTTGWVIAQPIQPDLESKGIIDLYKASENPDGTVSVHKTATTVTVPLYADPTAEPAAQKGTTDTLDALDSRFTHVVSAIDPDRGGATALWTAHTVVHGADPGGTTEVRWYEINAAGHNLFQSGTVSDGTGWAFNGVISPDRTVGAGGTAHGGDMVLGFNTSSATEDAAVQMVSKVGAQPVSGFVKLFTSPGPDQGLDCAALGGACRWGDYAGAVPDPAASLSAPTGRVWLSAMTSTGGAPSDTNAEWSTYNWAATP
jgi:hypothetical protein